MCDVVVLINRYPVLQAAEGMATAGGGSDAVAAPAVASSKVRTVKHHLGQLAVLAGVTHPACTLDDDPFLIRGVENFAAGLMVIGSKSK